jgi:YbbR domain-containing protein
VRRILGRIVHNWPLKLAAVGLATLMYGGLALSQNTQTFPGIIPARYVNEPTDAVISPSTPRPVTQVRYFAPQDVSVATSTFVATVDLSSIGTTTGVVSAPVTVTTPDNRVRILSWEPTFVTIEVDHLKSLDGVPVKVTHGAVPDGLTLGPTVVDPATVTVSGASAIVDKVDSVRADVEIQSSGIDVDEDVQLVPIDKLGNALSPLDVTPATAHVKIAVFSDRQTRTLPVNPVITGQPAAGFEIASVTVIPSVALVAGDADQIAQLSRVDTAPVSMTGVSDDETVRVALALPVGVIAVGDDNVAVTIDIRPVTATRTFDAGLRLVGARSDLRYALSTDRVLVTIGGSTADLDRLSASTLVVDLDVTGLAAGSHDVPVSANLPTGLTLVAASPAKVTVTVTPVPAASAGPNTAPGPSPSGS